MSALDAILTGWLGVATGMTVLWAYQAYRKQADIVDVGWTVALIFLAWWFAIEFDGEFARRALVVACVSFWGGRLAWHLFVDRVLHPEEDGRYQALRAYWQNGVQWKFFLFFQAQGVLAVLLSMSFLVACTNAASALSIWDLSGGFVCCVAVFGESIADHQLRRFKADPSHAGKTCRIGLWRYSRHPNYFFEWLHWWTYFFLSIGSPYVLVTVIAPVLMLFFVCKVTGIPPTELRALKTRGDDYRLYQQTTSAFFPWFPKEDR